MINRSHIAFPLAILAAATVIHIVAVGAPVVASFLPWCYRELVGRIVVRTDGPSYDHLEKSYSKWVTKGGRSHPSECIPRSKVAIIVPYR